MNAIAALDLIRLLSTEDILDHQILSDGLKVWVSNLYAAEVLWQRIDEIKPNHLEIYIGFKHLYPRYSTRIKPKSSGSEDLNMFAFTENRYEGRSLFLAAKQEHRDLLGAIPDPVIIYSLDDEFRVRHLQYPLHPKQFNKPPAELMADGGKPLAYWDESIAVPRRQAIEEAIATGQKVIRPYTNRWKGFEWKLLNQVIHLPDYNEVLVIVGNQENCEWQRSPEMWRSLVE